MKTWIAMDNGVSGQIGIVHEDGTHELHRTPVRKVVDYTKKEKHLNRLDVCKLTEILQPYKGLTMMLERPMINSRRFNATISAVRCLEATLIVLESLGMPYKYIDSKEWQHELLPRGIKGPALKAASLALGKSIFPKLTFKGVKDADGILIAEYLRRKDCGLLSKLSKGKDPDYD